MAIRQRARLGFPFRSKQGEDRAASAALREEIGSFGLFPEAQVRLLELVRKQGR
jgi:hypothetical protein